MMCYEKPKNWGTYLGKVTSYDGKRYITIDNSKGLNIGDGIEIWNGENSSPSTIVSELTNNKIGRITGNIRVGDKVYKTSDKKLLEAMKETYSRGFVKKTDVNITLDISLDSPIKICINDFEFETSVIPEKAQKNPMTKEKIFEQLNKTGNTPFKIANFELNMTSSIFLPVSKINEIRRTSFEAYEKHILQNDKHILQKTSLKFEKNKYISKLKNITLCVKYLNEDLLKVISDIDEIYVPVKEVITKEELFSKINCKKYILLPTITKAKYNNLIKNNFKKLADISDGFVVSNIGQLDYFKDIKTNLIANYTFNIFNNYTLKNIEELGFSKAILSPELTNEQINNLTSGILKEAIVYGNQCVMTSEHCPIGAIAGGFCKDKKCNMPCLKNDKYYLRDRLKMDFRIIPDNIDCQSTLYNSKITSIESKNLNVDSIRLDIIDENYKEILNIIAAHKYGNKLSGDIYTNAHAVRPV